MHDVTSAVCNGAIVNPLAYSEIENSESEWREDDGSGVIRLPAAGNDVREGGIDETA